ncbi:MAG: Ig-like domain-containing protein [Verrucomicrobiota bacterium]
MPILRTFLIVALLTFVPGTGLRADEVIRIMAANTTTGNFSSYDPGEGNRIFQGLDPDIVLVQEMNVGVAPNKNTPATYAAWVTANFGSSFSYHVEPTISNGDIPNGIVSRYPITAAGEWDDTTMTNRDYVWAKINIPGDKDLWVVSVHISSNGGTSQRNEEAGEIRSAIQTNVPAGDYLVLGGDFNTSSRTEACITTLSTVVVTTGPFPVDQAGDGDTNNGTTRNSPFDWVMPDTDLNALKTPLVIGSNTFPNGLVFDSRVYSPLSEVAPIRVTDSDRFYPNDDPTNMQHMAVMRAFLIPTNDPPVIAQGTTISRTISQNNHPTPFAASLTATDADGNPLAWNISAAAAHGSATIIAPATGGSVSLGYTPANDYLGSDSFTARVSDGAGGTDTIVVNVTVNSVGAYDAWTFDRFAPLLPAGQTTTWGESANPDHDAYTNLAEFAYGLNPAVTDVALNPMAISFSGGLPVLSFLVRMDGSVPALQYDLQAKADLTTSAWPVVAAGAYTQISETVVNTDFRRRVVKLNSTGGLPRTFYRLRIRR